MFQYTAKWIKQAMKLIIYLLILLGLITGCNSDSCGNTGTPEGKYVSNDHNGAELYILINKDSTFLHYYKDKNGKVKSYKGKWKISKINCEMSLSPWTDLEMEKPLYKNLPISALIENDKLQPHQDLPIYRKVD
jgi:hypothetical protein